MSSSASLMSSHGVALATAVAVSGTVILIALRRQKPFPHSSATLQRNPTPLWCHLRPCMSSSSEERKRERPNKKKKMKKRVQFAEQVVELEGNGSEDKELLAQESVKPRGRRQEEEEEEEGRARGMPANRVALYSGILRDRGMQRMACCY